MKVKIIKSSKDSYWYVNKLGEVFTVRRAIEYPFSAGKGYEVNNQGTRSFIDIDDAEIIFEDFK